MLSATRNHTPEWGTMKWSWVAAVCVCMRDGQPTISLWRLHMNLLNGWLGNKSITSVQIWCASFCPAKETWRDWITKVITGNVLKTSSMNFFYWASLVWAMWRITTSSVSNSIATDSVWPLEMRLSFSPSFFPFISRSLTLSLVLNERFLWMVPKRRNVALPHLVPHPAFLSFIIHVNLCNRIPI